MSSARLPLILVSLVLAGCASTSHNPKDPFESFNRGMYQFNDTVDKAVVKPAAKGYNAVMPAPGKMMVSNFFSNLDDVIVAINDLLQFKIVRAISDSGRIVVNTTVGLLGLVDVASHVGLEKHNEDFGQTLGRWGIGSGPYLVLPFFGPSSVRDGAGLYADSRASMMRKIYPVDTRNQLYAANILSKRTSLLDQEKVLDEAMIDEYSFIRDAYMQRRRNLIYDGNPPREKIDEGESDGTPDKTSINGSNEIMQSGEVEAAVATPVVTTIAEPLVQQQPGVYRVWLTQHEGIR